jgi:hypothetical protein
VKLFISYRRRDSTHVAARVRMCLQQKFGVDAAFIDREIPPGRPWEEYLESMLSSSTGVIVLVGDEFLRELRQKRAGADDGSDTLVWEIATAIRLKKTIYPVVFGASDMPEALQLPQAIRQFAAYQAVFAREPAFDAAMDVLIKSLAADHSWVDSAAPGTAAVSADGALRRSLERTAWWTMITLLAPAGLWWIGRVILWLGAPDASPVQSAESAFWHGVLYALSTALLGLGPYLAYWVVVELRARARLPIFNVAGVLALLNLAVVLVSGGTFLLLSTLPGWRLQPLLILPAHPAPGFYVALAIGLLAIVLLALAVVVGEPRMRGLTGGRRAWGMRVLHGGALLVTVCALWFAASLVHSVPALGALDPVPVIGYMMLCPALSLFVAGWSAGRSLLGLHAGSWQAQTLLGLVLGLYVCCTLALFTFGPMRLIAAPLS